MALFVYSALERGKRTEGMIEAENQAAAATQLKARRLIPLKLEAAKGKRITNVHRGRMERGLCRFLIRPMQVELALSQLGQVIRAGVPIVTALESVGAQAPYHLRRVFADIIGRVRSGQSLEHSLREEAPFFGKVTLGLIGVGEANGTLDDMLRYSSDLLERSRKVKAQVLGALAYPSAVVLGAFGLGYYMVNNVIPQIMSFIGAQDPSSLPLVTQYLMMTTDFLKVYGVYIMAAPVVLVVLVTAARKNRRTAPKVDAVMLWIPPVGKALREHANTMWCRTLGALLSSGVDILSALELVCSTLDNACYAERLNAIRNQIRQGATLTRAYRENGMKRLCPMAYTMISVSEDSGGLDESLLHVASYSEEELTRRVSMLSKMIEPAVFVLVGGMVGFVYFAFFLAMLAATNNAAGL